MSQAPRATTSVPPSDGVVPPRAPLGTPLEPPRPPTASRPPWTWRLRDMLAAYLPVLLMASLALGTWWLVKSTPEAEAPRPVVAPRHEPDYTMHQFVVRRYAADGRLRVELEGDQLRHYPDTDTMEVDQARVRAIDPQGRVTIATAKLAVANGDATEVQLIGEARVRRGGLGDELPVFFEGEFLHAFLDTERLRSHLPVTVTQGATRLQGDGVEYDNLDRVVQFRGRVKAVFPPRGAASAASGASR